jgi:hypothetical protein
MDKDLAAIDRQQLMMGLSDRPGQWNDAMAPFRDLLQAQLDALSGESDDGFSAMTAPF